MSSWQRWGGWALGGAMLTTSLAGCGNRFAANCKATHTCPPPRGGAGNDGDAIDSAGAASGGGVATAAEAGEASGGSSPTVVDCDRDADCESSEDGARCVDGECVPDNGPPSIVSITPEDGATNVEPGSVIEIVVSEPLDAATVTTEHIKLLDRGVEVSGQLAYAERVISFTPEKPLGLLARYEVSVSTGIKDADGTPLAAPFSSQLEVRDGAWSVTTIKAGAFAELSPQLPIDDDGRSLLAWIDGAEGACPVKASWFQRGEALTPVRELNFSRTHYCSALRAGGSSNGFALLSWYEEDNQGNGLATVEFRQGNWGAPSQRNNRNDTFSGAVGAAADGTMHYFAPGSEVLVWSTTANGEWSTDGVRLSPRRALGDVQLAVAVTGDAVAAWRDQRPGSVKGQFVSQMLVASYSAEAKTWSVAESLPGSLTTAALDGEPQPVFDAQSAPSVLWRLADSMVVSRFLIDQNKWSNPQPISAQLNSFPSGSVGVDPPALAFDGTTLVAAFTAGTRSRGYDIYISRYDQQSDQWSPPEQLSNSTTRAAGRMPLLSADARGNLLVLWASVTATTGVFRLASRRYVAEESEWSEPALFADISINNADLELGRARWAFGANAGGAAALAFADKSTDWAANLRLASFY